MSLFRSHLKLKPSEFPDPVLDEALATQPGERLAVLAGGCFWCTEAVYRDLAGVLAVSSGYAGGDAASADYRSVCTGTTDHAEVIQVAYDPSLITLGRLLKVFFAIAHDPTQLDRQGNDIGSQYRSAVFYADEEQRRIVSAYIAQLEAAAVFNGPIVTRLEPLEAFFEAEAYHQDYAARNPHEPYIAAVAAPKVEKLKAYFGSALKTP